MRPVSDDDSARRGERDEQRPSKGREPAEEGRGEPVSESEESASEETADRVSPGSAGEERGEASASAASGPGEGPEADADGGASGSEQPAAETGEADGTPAPSGRQRLAQALWPPRVTRAQVIVAVLLFVLGLGLAIQVRSTSENSALRGARHEDLVRILDELDDRTKRLEDEKQELQGQRTELETSSDQAEEARKQTREKEQQLGVLAGTVAAEGPGIRLTIGDPGGAVEADMLLDTVQELRAAGAEAIQVNGVRVVASSYFSDTAGGVEVDKRQVKPPYRFSVIGKPKDLEPALNIPGGVAQTLKKEQATVDVQRSDKITVDALRSAKRPDYARSSSS